MAHRQATFRVQVGSQEVELPIVDLGTGTSIALMMTIDRGVAFSAKAGSEIADHYRDAAVDIVVAPATLGIPLAIEISRSLGLDDYLILQKTAKHHLRDALRESVTSITSGPGQQLLLDRARVDAVAGKRVLLVDDVISTGGAILACVRLLELAGATIVGIAALLTEGDAWRDSLADHAEQLFALGSIPLMTAPPEA